MSIDLEDTPITERLLTSFDVRTATGDNDRLVRLEADAMTMQEDIAWLQRTVEELKAQLDFVRGKLRLQHGRLMRLEGTNND